MKIIGEEEILGVNNGDLDKAIERVDKSKCIKTYLQ